MKGLKELKNLSIHLDNRYSIDETFEFDAPNNLSMYTSLDYKELILLPQNEIPNENYHKIDFYSWTNDIIRLDILDISLFNEIYNSYKTQSPDDYNLNTFIKDKINSFVEELINKGYTDIICSLIYNSINYNNSLKDTANSIYPIFSISLSYKDYKILIPYYNNGVSIITSYKIINNQLINDIKTSLKSTFINDL